MRQLRVGAIGRIGLLSVALLLVAMAPGCGVPRPDSEYIPMDDGTLIAVDLWLPRTRPADGQVPTVLRLGRYWRDYQLPSFLGPALGRYPNHVSWLHDAGYAVVIADVRGTGASFGVSTTPWSPREIADYPQVVDWIVAQPWSDGRVGAYGVSYDGVTADWLGAAGHPAVKAILPTYSYCDVYLDVSHPGGILNDRFIKAWGNLSYEMDRNNPDFLHIVAAADPSGLVAQFVDVISLLMRGVRPVDYGIMQLLDALAEHAANTHVYEATRQIEFRDDTFGVVTVGDVSPLLGADGPGRSVAIRRIVGWLDAGSTRGALRSFNTLEVDHHVIVIAPQNHSGNYYVDPYNFAEPQALDTLGVIDQVWQAVPFFDEFLRGDGAPQRHVIYYTYVEDVWKQTAVWPPQGFEMRRWYFAAAGLLRREPPTDERGADVYAVDFNATTGLQNRWFSGLGGVPIHYAERAAQDERLLVYATPPLEQDHELTGHPVVSLRVRSTHADGAFYVYLEDVAPDGKVVYLTEGQLRAVHRRVSDRTPPAAVFGPHHTFECADALPLVPGEVAEITFDLLPISTLIRRGHRIRVAIAGHDRDTFVRHPAQGAPTLDFQRNVAHASHIDLPMKLR